MSSRHKNRRLALQLLYQNDLMGCSLEETLEQLSEWSFEKLPEGSIQYTRQLVRGVHEKREDLDNILREQSEHWKLERMALVERNLLRIAVYELIYRQDIPAKVIINEAVDLAKEYGDEKAGSFVNGILDAIANRCRDIPTSDGGPTAESGEEAK